MSRPSHLLQVPVLLLLENSPLREAADVVCQPWFKLYHFIGTWRSDLDLDAWAHSTKGLAAHPQGFQRQLDAIAALRPEHVAPTYWDMLVQDRLRQAVRSGYHWEELLSSWVALYCKIAQVMQAAAATATAAAGRTDAGAGLGVADDSEGAAGVAGVAAAAVPELPEFDAFLLHMFALEADPQVQLDYVAEFRPPSMSLGNWDTEIGKVRSPGLLTATCMHCCCVFVGLGSCRPSWHVCVLWAVTQHTSMPCNHESFLPICQDLITTCVSCAVLVFACLQLLAQVAYLKAISSSYQPVHSLQPTTTRLMCHGARHKSTRDLLDGWAAAALRPVATLLQPLQTHHWSDSHPSGRDLEAAIAAAAAASSSANAARRQLLQGVPAPVPANPAIRAPAAAAAVGGAGGSKGPVGVHALNRFCWDTATKPHAAEAVELAARAALPPGTDMTPADVAAVKAAAAKAAEAAVAHALLLSTLPVWFVPGETGACSAALQNAAQLLPMPAYGLSLDSNAVTAAAEGFDLEPAFESLPALGAHCVQQLLSVQHAGPYVLVGCGIFSCLLASAMVSELEGQLQHRHVVLVLLDGPPATPSSWPVPDPVLYGLYELLRDAGRLPTGAEGGRGAPVGFAAWAAQVSAGVQVILAAGVEEGDGDSLSHSSSSLSGGAPASSGVQEHALLFGAVSEQQEAAVETAVVQFVSALLAAHPAGGVAESGSSIAAAAAASTADVTAALHRMLECCRLVRRLCSSYAGCEFVYQVPAVLLLTEDAPGQAFLEVARER